jgi:hypothetical protein
MSYGLDLADNWRKAAASVAKILSSAKPAELYIERPTKVELDQPQDSELTPRSHNRCCCADDTIQ